MTAVFTPAPRTVLGIAAHPDDLDYYAGGIMAAFVQVGAEVSYLILTDGAKGSQDRSVTPQSLRDLRRDEQRQAAKILGLKEVRFLDYPDGELENSLGLKKAIVKAIRQLKPDVVVTLDPSVLYIAGEGFINHPDHRAAGQATLDAVYPLARDHLAFPDLLAQGYEPHRTKTLLLCALGQDSRQATYISDITDTFERKLQAVAAHASQFGEFDQAKTSLEQQAATTGKPHGYDYAESFVRVDIA